MEAHQIDAICRYVAGVSWPRSGHHLAVNVLKEYFGVNFSYCEFYTPKDCCRAFPCVRRDSVKFSKNHDFHLRAPISDSSPYLIQYRAFLPSVVSAYEMFVAQGQPDTPDSFEHFATSVSGMYNAFLERWVFGTHSPRERLVLRYEEITSDGGVHFIALMIRFFAPNHNINYCKLKNICVSMKKEFVENGRSGVIDRFGIKDTRDIEAFRFYDKRLFAKLGALTRKSEEKSLRALERG